MVERRSQPIGFEHIAVIGMGCRFPGGVNNPDDYWNLLTVGGNGVSDIPPDRWDVEKNYDPDPGAPGKMHVKRGAFIENVRGFDPYLFGITPREAVAIDPQQRLLLEISWEALENAGIPPDSLRGSEVGVFVGITNDDYAARCKIWSELESIDNFTFTGVARSVASGRIAYAFDLSGPAMQLDTACSSSLMAVYQACQSLSLGECDLALAGGVNLMLSPATTISLCKLNVLSPDGECRAFDAGANGYVRGEGGGIAVLKRLSDAKADNDSVFAVIRGAAVNQDGSSNGIAAPNGAAQKKLLRRALTKANLDRHRISYVEAHGTATTLGDFTEAGALGEAYGRERPADRPLYIGSVKTNIGHLEAGAGVASLMKTALMLRHGEIPPSLNFTEPNPRIPWEEFGMAVPVAPVRWDRLNGPRAAGVSAFGVSGTNVHLILEEAPAAKVPENDSHAARPYHVLALSANDRPALTALAKRYDRLLEDRPDTDLADICFSANTGRARLRHRRAVAGRTVGELREQLNGARDGTDSGNATAFLFSGQGSQYEGMAEQLFDTSPIFRESMERCDDALSADLKPGLLEVLYGDPANRELIHRTAYTQPALFALQYALARLWMSWGIAPTCVTGHSIGEYAAACIAGAFSMEDGIGLAALRGRLMQALPTGGRMLAVAAGAERIAGIIETSGPQVSVAAVNAPALVVVSGGGEAIGGLETSFREQGISTRSLNVSHAFHSADMAPMLDQFREAAECVQFNSPRIPYVSAVTGTLAQDRICHADYWVEHIRKPVLFLDAMRALVARKPTDFIEIGPASTLLDSGRRCLDKGQGQDWGWFPSLGPVKKDWQVVSEGLAALYERGADVDWSAFDEPYTRSKTVLPTYPFQRRDYWIETAGPRLSSQPEEPRSAARIVAGSVSGMLPGLEDRIRAIRPGLDAAALRYMLRTVRQLGVNWQVGQRSSVGALLGTIPERHHKIVDRMIGHLVGHGLLARTGDEIEVMQPVPESDPDDMLRGMERDRTSPEIDLVRRAGEMLTEILRGDSEALSVFFPGGSTEEAAEFYTEAPLFEGYNRLAARVVDNVLRHEPDDKALRVLEIGAGTGGLSAHILPRFPADRTEYVFTDISPLFLNAAERRFGKHAFLRTARLDISLAPGEQGFEPGSFDMIVAANVLHATPHLRRTVAHARSLLREDGWLLLLECTSPPLWGDMVFALLGGWWLFEDRDLRPDYPLIPADRWSRVLAETGFRDPVGLNDGDDAMHTLFVSQAGKWKNSAPARPVPAVADKARPVQPGESDGLPSSGDPSWSSRRRLVLACAASVMEMPQDMIDPARPLNEYGMDSLMTLEFAAMVHRQTGIELPISVLSDEVSVDKAYAYVSEFLPPEPAGEQVESEERADADTSSLPFVPVGPERSASIHPATRSLRAGTGILLPLRENGGGEPVFFVPAGYGDLFAFRDVAALLDVDRSVYGLQPPTAEAVRGVRDMSIHWLVSSYITEIKSLQPTGPYSITGYSAGGIVALEVARELIRTGDAISLLTILDAPSRVAPWVGMAYAGFCMLSDILRLGSLPKWARTRWIDRCLHAITDEGLRTHNAIVRAHRIMPYPDRITYFRPRRSWVPVLSIAKPWRKIARGGLEFHWLPGSHFGMFRGKYAETFAAILSDCLRRTRQP